MDLGTEVFLPMNYFLRYIIYLLLLVYVDMVARHWVSGERSLVVKGTLNPPVPVLAGHPIPTALLMNISVGKCVVSDNIFQIRCSFFFTQPGSVHPLIFSYPNTYPFICVCACVCMMASLFCSLASVVWCQLCSPL